METDAAQFSQSAPKSVILVVDDDDANRESLSRRLQRRGYETVTAPDGNAALEAVEKRQFDLILLDVMMPGISGLQVLERIRRTKPATELPIIMATAKDQSEDVVDALNRGASDYVTKPLDFSVVMARVQTQLRLREAVQQVVRLERRLSQRNEELEVANQKLRQAADRTARELDLAAKVQATFLPRGIPQIEGVEFAWKFEPCEALAGDALNICQLDAENVGLYILDVTGHGVAAALTAVAATRLLAPGHDPNSILVRRGKETLAPIPPQEVATKLSQRFTWNAEIEQFMTIFYGVLNTRSREFTYASAGHPGAVRIDRANGSSVLEGTGLPIGVGEKYEQKTVQMQSGDRLYLYSDGVTESMNARKDLFGAERMMQVLTRLGAQSLEISIDALLNEIGRWREGAPAKDDVSLLAVQFS